MATMTAAFEFDEHDSGYGYGWGSYPPHHRRHPVDCQVRPFPNEQVILWRKPEIDNSRLLRRADPRIGEACWKLFSATALLVVLIVGLLLPNAYSRLSDIQMEQLRQRNHTLIEEKRRLEIQQAELTSYDRLDKLAIERGMEDPSTARVHHLGAEVPGSYFAGNPAR